MGGELDIVHIPQQATDGDAFVGSIAIPNSDYFEYIGACLISPLQAGTTYTFNLDIAAQSLVATQTALQSYFAFQLAMPFQSLDLVTKAMTTKCWQLQRLVGALLAAETGKRSRSRSLQRKIAQPLCLVPVDPFQSKPVHVGRMLFTTS